MANRKQLFFAVALLASAVSGSVFAGALQDSNLLSSEQVYQLTPHTSTYSTWARWISDKLNNDANIADFSNGTPIKKHFDVPTNDIITIKVLIPPSSQRDMLITANSQPVGPPTPLPMTGTPGERITIIDATRTYYASWTYQWADGGGWNLIASSYHDCGDSTNKSVSTTCAAAP